MATTTTTPMHDSWKTGSGLPDDIDITITDVRWEFGDPFKDGPNAGEEPCRAVFVYEDEDGDDGELFLACGKGWEPGPKGESVVREDGKKRQKFNNRSPFGYWINAAATLDGVSADMGALETTKKATWVGTKWHILRNEEKFTIQGTERVSERVYPSEFQGRVGKKAAAAKANTKAAATETADETSADEGVDTSVPRGKLLASLKSLATEHDNAEDFQAAALELDAVNGNVEMQAWVLEDSNYATLREE